MPTTVINLDSSFALYIDGTNPPNNYKIRFAALGTTYDAWAKWSRTTSKWSFTQTNLSTTNIVDISTDLPGTMPTNTIEFQIWGTTYTDPFHWDSPTSKLKCGAA